jgi:hypothetical protein
MNLEDFDTFDVKGDVDWNIEHDKDTFLTMFGGAVAEEVKKCTIRHKLETRPHTFKDGSEADICKRLTIVIDFNDAIVQPHSNFESDFGSRCVEALEENINGLMENSDPEDGPESEEDDDEGYF